MARKLTKRVIDSLKSDTTKGTRTYDAKLAGFYVTAFPDGRKTFGVRYGGRKGRKRLTLGTYGEMTVEAARDAAARALSQAKLAAVGQAPDPAALRNRRRDCPTWGEWTILYTERAQLEKKSAASDARYLGLAPKGGPAFRAFRGKLSSRLVSDISVDDLLKFRDSLKKTPVQANRWVASVRACLAAAVRAGHISMNPARDIPQFREGTPRQRVLSAEETTALIAAVDAEKDLHARAGLLLLMTTGARLSEALRATWADLSDLEGERPTWTIPSPKAGTPQAVPLPANVVKVLRSLPRRGPFIVAGRAKLAPRRDLKGPWLRALTRARLTGAGLTIHDLRRSHGLEVYRTSGLLAAQKLLRHSDPRVTAAVYVPLAAEDLRGAQEKRAALLKFKTPKAAGGRRKGA